ncbi:MAG: alpha-2-macroglobulin [Planctomycetales bacterium]|nr:alpha-2-macroglobulin [Planctomycetales bacterium]
MMDNRPISLVATILTLLFVAALTFRVSAVEGDASDFEQAKQLSVDGNYQEALVAFQKLLGTEGTETAQLVEGYQLALTCFAQLNRVDEIDGFRETLAEQFQDNWQLLTVVADSYLQQDHFGYMLAGEFHRGRHRGGGKVVNATARDRARALQLYQQSMKLLEQGTKEQRLQAAALLLDGYASALLHGGQYGQSWRLQALTDIDELPDYEEGWGQYSRQPQGAPVDADGKPVLYDIPPTWEDAKNDGERWRWILEKSVQWNPELRTQERFTRARFLESQFGVETLANYGWWFGRRAEQDMPTETGTFALHTLGENETIARLATGIKRFELPDDQNPIKLYQQILEDLNDESAPQQWRTAVLPLAVTFENRRQYERAAEYWRLGVEKKQDQRQAQNRLDQITKSWGRFEGTAAQPAGKGATIDFRFRNGHRVDFVARKVKVRELLDDVKSHIKSNPQHLDWNQVQLENLGYRLVIENQEKYLGAEVARWNLNLEPLDGHFDRRITVATPLQEPGAYLLSSKMADGNEAHVVVWLNDTAIVKKPLAGKSLYYVADAVSGHPLAKCNVEFFGFWQENLQGTREHRLHVKNFAKHTDEQGLVELAADDQHRRHQWVTIATTPEGRLAYLGFRNVWSGEYYDQEYKQVKVFSITDRPVYRPAQTVHFKFWVCHAQYDLADESRFAGKSFLIEVRDPRNEKVYSTQLVADAYGGLAGSWDLPAGATLGQYFINVVNHGGGSFRVEEYKKPEFEVTVDAPAQPVALGEKITATISAKYLFGSPVTQGKVKYKILRTSHDQQWYPPMPWDWLYGPGYWWFAAEYDWYPGWARWGCRRPSPWWIWRSPAQPEVVAEQEVVLGPEGTIEVEIDTSVAQQFHPDQDHSYQIQAEVVDESRRTIVGNGSVLVARKPFRVYVWTDRGHYRAGDTIALSTSARTLDGQPVAGVGVLRLLKIQYNDAKPVETEVGRWELPTGETGQAALQIKASEPGQYRLSYELTDNAGHAIEGGHLLTIAGEGFNGSEFQFNDLEITPDRPEYQAGDKAALQINTNRSGAAVLLFVRPTNGVYLRPQMVQLQGKSQVVELEVTAKDTPNFFVEAVTVHSGKVHTVTRELFVPPASRVLNVEVVPSADAYLPGQAAKILLKLTDNQGKPYVGSLAVAMYDKALEYISGGSNVAEIRDFFWKWRRQHQPQGESSLERLSEALVRPNHLAMQDLGVFGASVVDELDGAGAGTDRYFGRRKSGESRGLALGEELSAEKALPMAAAAPMAPAEERFDSEQAGSESELAQPMVRENFADTALWVGALETNAEGLAEVKLDMPENLTTWKVRVWGMGHGTRVGEGSAEVVTRKNIIIRLQAPRFFIERDEVVLSANVHNYLPESKQIRVQLALAGNTLQGPGQLEQVIDLDAGGEQRVDWRVNVQREGTATIRMSALTDKESDAVEMQFPVYVHGMLKTDSFTGVIRPDQSQGTFTVDVPAERRAEQTRLEVRYTPTLAGAMVDALPYMIDYPYGCTEQTLNRFLPAVVTQRTLQRMGLDLAAIQEKRTNLNSQEIGDDQQRAKDWKRFEKNPVFDEEQLGEIVSAGVNRLTEMQLSDGGWGWFSGFGERSYPHTTAVVVRGLLIAQENGVALVPGVIEKGVAWLSSYQAEQVRLLELWDQHQSTKPNLRTKQFADNTDALVYMVLSEAKRAKGASPSHDSDSTSMRDHLYRDRTKLAVYSLATFGLALQNELAQNSEQSEMLAMVLRNISQYVHQDEENQTAWLELPGGSWWYWYGSEFEAHAYYLKLLTATDPNSEVAPQLVKYLLNNRKHATYWNSTRDTALVVEAFADYLRASGEDAPEVVLEVWIDGQQRKRVEINRDNLFSFDNQLVLAGEALAAGKHTVEIRKQGTSPIYYNGYLTNFTLEDHIEPAGLEIKVSRRYYKLTPAEKTAAVAGGRGQVVNQRVEKYDRTELVNFAELKSGDLVEVELEVDSKNDYEYILLEDMKAAGFEPVAVRSGYNGNELGAYLELRDDRVSLFVARLARGKHSVSYRLRAEIPGTFSALPTRASAMYAPELRANSEEIKLQIVD